MNNNWELVSNRTEDILQITAERLSISGGWLVRTASINYKNKSQSESCAFIPDPNHEWMIE